MQRARTRRSCRAHRNGSRTLLEPLIRQRYADLTGVAVITIPTTFRSEQYPWMIANLDGIAHSRGRLFEAKNARSAPAQCTASARSVYVR